ncbi:MAG: hypothetical protein JWO26_353 [Rhodospirillales bacterium]|jgi:hypothetical protein|nr:hypothetical protein [Rhodospirillales bacterium]MDB5380721.1 hypothetical protein [Rhodospirillales bacterium]
MWWTVPLLLALTLPLTCCATGGGIDPCGPWRPILMSGEDRLTPATAADLLAHNETGRRLCGW